MARELLFSLGGSEISLAPVKIERKKLYGWTELRATDPQGNPCRQAGLNSDGVTIIPKGATKIGMLREDGLWMEKNELHAVNADGSEAQQAPSSFDSPIPLTEKVSMETLLDCVISSVYQLEGEQAETLVSLLGNDIYTFPFSYRGGYETSDAFLMSNGKACFILTGTKAQFEFIGLEQAGVIDEPDDEVEIEEDDLDFSMI